MRSQFRCVLPPPCKNRYTLPPLVSLLFDLNRVIIVDTKHFTGEYGWNTTMSSSMGTCQMSWRSR